MRITAALEGNLETYMKQELRVAESAVSRGVEVTAKELQAALRADTRSHLGRRVGNTWRRQDYPKGQKSLGAASLVYSKAPELIGTFETGATIRSDSGTFLAIPTASAPKQGVGRKRLTPANFPEHRYGPLRYVYVKRGLSLLVVDNQRERKGKRGGYTLSRSKRARATGYGLLTVPMFFLVPQVRLRRRLSVREITEREASKLARNIDWAFNTLGNRS